MVSASRPALEGASPAVSAQVASSRPVARLNARVSAYLVDSVILFALVLVFFVVAGVQLLIASNRTDGDPSDASFTAAIVTFSAGTLLSWTLLNLALMRWRGQTTGKYVIGIRIVTEDKSPLTIGRALLRWFALHPLLFHPFLVIPWVVFTLLSVDFALSPLGFVLALALVLLTIASLLVNLLAVLLDSERRTLHDRLARTLVVHLDGP